MITVNPQGLVYLCKTPLENDYKNQLTFTTAAKQLEYFTSTVQNSFDNYTYIRKDNTLKVGVPIDDIINCNYLFYQNKGFTSKYYYCFITNMSYVNENCTLITFETDCFQTYQFDIVYKSCFTEREHVSDDTIGLHTIPENLETGEYICAGKTDIYSGGNSTYVCVATTEVPEEVSVNPFNTEYNGVYSGTIILLFRSALAVTNFTRAMDGLGKGDAIQNIFLAPTGLCGTPNWTVYNVEVTSSQTITFEASTISNSSTATSLGTSANITVPTTFDSYTPKNNKLYCFPYNYFYLSNNIGADVSFHYEDFVNNTASFKILGALSIGCSIKAFPLNYKKLSDTASSTNSYNAGVVGSKYPVCSWKSDAYTNWLTQNSVNIAGVTLNAEEKANAMGIGALALGSIMTATGLGSGIGTGLMVYGAGAIFNSMQTNYQKDIIPQQAKGSISAGDVTYASGNTTFPIYKMCIRKEYAEIIDGYLSAYGYKVNKYKIPNITGRTNWNYVKTIECNFEGDIPQGDLNTIKNMFNTGVTMWHNPATMYDYSASNGIVS